MITSGSTSLISHIYSSSTKQTPLKDPKQSIIRQLSNFPEKQTLFLFPSLGLFALVFPIMVIRIISYFLLDSAKTLLGFLRHSLFPWKSIASKIHLPAWDTVHHSRVTITHVTPGFAPTWADRLHELGIGLRPLVQVHVGGANWYARVTCVIHTVGYANWGHGWD